MENNIKREGAATTETVYEVSFLLLPFLALEQVPREMEFIKESIISCGGAIISEESPVLIDLSYPMTKVVGTTRHKADSGYFGWIKFEMQKDTTTEGIEELKKALDGALNILRYLIIKTVRENTLLHGKMMLRKEEKTRREEIPAEEVVAEKEVVPETSTEDLDKSIDDLVIV